MVVIHHNDTDGRCAAAIVGHAHELAGDPAPKYIEMDYARELPFREIPANEPVVIVDFSLKPEVMAKLLEITPNVTWIDHHATAKAYDYGRELPGLRNFEHGSCQSGAYLAWKYFFGDLQMPRAVELISDFDTWTHKSGPLGFQLIEALRMIDHSPDQPIWGFLLDNHFESLHHLCLEGELLIKYRDMYCADIVKNFGHEAKIVGFPEYSCYALNLYRFGSLAFGDLVNKYDVCVAYIFDGTKWTVSFYSLTKDVSVIAKSFGGGGHRGASGCVTDDLKKVVANGNT